MRPRQLIDAPASEYSSTDSLRSSARHQVCSASAVTPSRGYIFISMPASRSRTKASSGVRSTVVPCPCPAEGFRISTSAPPAISTGMGPAPPFHATMALFGYLS